MYCMSTGHHGHHGHHKHFKKSHGHKGHKGHHAKKGHKKSHKGDFKKSHKKVGQLVYCQVVITALIIVLLHSNFKVTSNHIRLYSN